MPNAAAEGVAPAPHDQNDAHRAVVSDLVSLIEHVQTSLRLIEQAVARESSLGNQENSANVVVLDDVSPRYTKVVAALQTCDANLGIALHSLQDCSGVGAYGATTPASQAAGA